MSVRQAPPPEEAASPLAVSRRPLAIAHDQRGAGVVVHKFGGSSLAHATRIRAVAAHVVEARRSGHQVAVVVSAMGGSTDELMDLARSVSAQPCPRELDRLLSGGERVSTALVAMAIRDLGEEAVSFTGSEAGLVTDDVHGNATILEVRPHRVRAALMRGQIAVVAGFQGESWRGETTTLGRGGSDTTAVALAAALEAEHCDVYSDVDGVYSGDPRVVASARRLDVLTYEEMQELARHGARVLNADAVEFARRRGIAIFARAAFGGAGHTEIRCDPAISQELDALRRHRVTGVSGRTDLLALRYSVPAGGPDRGDDILRSLEGCDLISAELGPLAGARLTAVIGTESLARPEALAASLRDAFGPTLVVEDELGAVSAVGVGVGSKAAALAEARAAIEAAGVPVLGGFTARESVSCIVAEGDVETALRALHAEFLDTVEQEEALA